MSSNPDHVAWCVFVTPTADKLQEVADKLAANATSVKAKEPGVIMYTVDIMTSDNDQGPPKVFVMVLFANQAAKDNHLQTDHFKEMSAMNNPDHVQADADFRTMKHVGGFMPQGMGM